jgi:HlyD family secretion protein
MNLQLSQPPRWLIGLAVVATVCVAGSAFYVISQFAPPAPTAAPPSPTKIGALGRLEPEAEVTKLAAPLALDGDRIARLLVKAGDRVKAGQVVAILDSRGKLSDALQTAQIQVQVATAKLAQVQAGAKTGEIAAQQATIARLQAELAGTRSSQAAAKARWQSEVRTAQAEFNRYQQLYQQGAVGAVGRGRAESVESIAASLNPAGRSNPESDP